MRRRSKLLGGFSAICLALAALAGCGGGSSDPQSVNPEAERQAAPAASVGSVAQGKEKEKGKKPVGGHPERPAAPKDSQADHHRSASHRTEGAKPAPSHRHHPTGHNPAAVVNELVTGGEDGSAERTEPSPEEVLEVIEEFEDSGPSSGSGSDSNPVQSVLDAIGD